MKYPIDERTLNEFFGHIMSNEKIQRETIKFLTSLIQDAMYSCEDEEEEWYQDANQFVKMQQDLKVYHENRIFDEENIKKSKGIDKSTNNSIPKTLNSVDVTKEFILNKTENKFGETMSEKDLARHFGEPSPRKNKGEIDLSKKNPFKNMTNEEILEWEKAQDNSNNIYKVKARVSNLARNNGSSLTPVGEMMVNSFVHVLKDLYDFVEKIEDKNLRIQLIERIRKHENMPGQLIAATMANVKIKK